MTKPESLDCVAVKRRARRALAKILAGKSPAEQAETLHRLVAQTPLWRSLAKPRGERPPRAVRAHAKRARLDDLSRAAPTAPSEKIEVTPTASARGSAAASAGHDPVSN
jgi:hypothetical protein